MDFEFGEQMANLFSLCIVQICAQQGAAMAGIHAIDHIIAVHACLL
jgi:hypothetical protein